MDSLTGEEMSRQEYTMTDEQLAAILHASRPVPYIIVGGVVPRSQQERANDAWARLGKELGFDSMTVKPAGKGDKVFTAIPA